MKTREKIKVVAIDKFNEFGATNMSTIRLSNDLGISPGNFYYYFTSKEHLIQVILAEEMAPKLDAIIYNDKYAEDVNGLVKLMEVCSAYVYEFRFFYAELYILQKNDPELLKTYLIRFDNLVKRAREMFTRWVNTGLFNGDIPDPVFMATIRNIWVVGVSWTGFASTYLPRTNTDKQVQKKVMHQAFNAFYPILTDKGRQELEEAMTKKGYIK